MNVHKLAADGFAGWDAARGGVEVAQEFLDVGDVDANLLDAAVDVAHDELAEAEASGGGGVDLGEGGQGLLVTDVGGHAQEAEGFGGDLGVFGDAADEDGGDEVLHVEAEDVLGVLGGDE